MVEKSLSQETASGLGLFGYEGLSEACRRHKLVGLLRFPPCGTNQALILALDPPLWPLLQLLEFSLPLRPSGMGRNYTALCQMWPQSSSCTGQMKPRSGGHFTSCWGNLDG